MEQYAWIFSLPSILFISFLGMLCHFLKRRVTGESLADINSYFMTHFKSTLIAVIATLVASTAYHLKFPHGDVTDILAALGIGYNCDSAFNSWEEPKKPS